MTMQDRRSSLSRQRFGNWLTKKEAKGDRKKAERRRIKVRLHTDPKD